MPAIFELKSNDDDQFYFHFLDSKGDLILMSGEFEKKEDAEQAIKDVRVGSLMSNQIAAGKVPEGDSFFVIKDTAGDILVKSVLFNSQMVFDNALHAVKDNACIAEISDLT
ncbi:MAG: YegP family protein [Gammaproteobacteria bacterium]